MTNSEENHSYLPTHPLSWQRITQFSYAAEPEGYSYVVHRSPHKDRMGFAYWFASAKANDAVDAIILGDAFMNRWEAIEVCEAWEYARVRARALTAGSEDTSSGNEALYWDGEIDE